MNKKINSIDLNKLSFQELKKEVENLSTKKSNIKRIKGTTYCIIRTYSAGVFAGLIDRNFKGKEKTIYDSRRIHYWDGAASLSQLANEGTKKPSNCRFAQVVEETDLKEIIEVIPCTKKAEENIKSVPVWEK